MNEKKIKILHVIGIMDYGGAETMIMNLYRKIDRDQFQFDFLVHRNREGDYDKEINELGGNIYYLPEYKVYNRVPYRKACKKFFGLHSEFDIVHGHIESCAAIYLNEAKKVGIYTIAHSHSTGFKSFFPKIMYNCLTFKTRYIADYFFACSIQAGKNRYGNKIVNSDEFSVFKNGIDAINYVYSREKHDDIKKKWHLNGAFVVGHVGRMSKEKNHVFLINIFKEICTKEKNAVLVLVGDGNEKSKLIRLVKEFRLEDRVIFTGNRSDIPEMMNLFDVFVFPSEYEGLGIALIEAQAAGLPCVVSDTIVNEAIITQDVRQVSLKETYKKWSEYIIKLSKNVCRKDNYKVICNAGFDIMKTTKSIEDFYKCHSKMITDKGD